MNSLQTKIMKQIDDLFLFTPTESDSVYHHLYFGCLDIFFENSLDNGKTNEEIDDFFDKDIQRALNPTGVETWYEYKPVVKQAFNKLLGKI